MHLLAWAAVCSVRIQGIGGRDSEMIGLHSVLHSSLVDVRDAFAGVSVLVPVQMKYLKGNRLYVQC